jgi:WD40 repeat protein
MSNIPFKGLNPYSEEDEDAQFFFGREEQIENIVERIKASRLTILHGESGVGKSSILRAGVTNRLRKEAEKNFAEYGIPYFAVVVFPPLEGNRSSWQYEPLTGLMKQIEEDIQKNISNIHVPPPGLSFVEALKVWTKHLGDEEEGELFVILDQFEEYFLYHPQEEKFAFEFCRAVNHSKLHVNFLISIRSDSFSKLNRFKSRILNVLSNNLELKHLDREAARRAIEKPIDKYNELKLSEAKIQIETALVEEVLDQVSQVVLSGNGLGGTEKLKTSPQAQIESPFLQLVMSRLWQEEMAVKSSKLRLQTLNKTLHRTTQIVNDHLTTQMKLLSENERKTAAIVFQYLVTPSGTKIAYPVLDLVKITTLKKTELTNLLEKLASGKQRILRPTGALPNKPDVQQYEIFHDVLAPAILDWRRQYLLGEERKRGLPTQSLRQQRRRQDELAALLARQAYLFSQVNQLHNQDQVDDALREALSASYFCNILQCPGAVSVTFSPDGRTVAAGSAEGSIRLWTLFCNPDLKVFIKVLKGDENAVYSIAFSPDGQLLASGCDENIRLWDLRQDEVVSRVLGSHNQNVTSVAFSPDGWTLASGSEDKTIQLWNLRQPDTEPIILTGHQEILQSVAFSPNGQLLASGSNDRTVRFWNLQDSSTDPIVRYGHEEIVRAVAFSPDGQVLASSSDDETIRLWDVNQSNVVPKVINGLNGHKERVRTVAFSPNGKMLASASDDQTIRLWNVQQLDKAPTILKGHYFDINSVAFSPDSQMLVSGSWDNTVRLWDLRQAIATPKVLKGHTENVTAVAYSPDGQMLASAGEDNTVRLWKLDQPEAEPFVFKHKGKVFAVTFFFSKDYQVQMMASGSTDQKVRLWDLCQPDAVPKELVGHQSGVSSVAFSPDGKMLASGSWDKTIRLWKLTELGADPIFFKELKEHSEDVTSVAFSPDGKTLASASNDRTIILWNLQNLDANPIVLRDHNGRVWSIVFSPDGQKLASASDDWSVRLWDLNQPHPTHKSLGKHNSWVSSVAFSPDGKTLASGGFDRSIKLWNLEDPDQTPILLEGHEQSVTSVAFSPDGKTLASGSYDNTIYLWITRTQVLADMVYQKVLRNLTIEEWKHFMGEDIPYEQICPNLPPGF